MSVRLQISAMLYLMIQAVLFGAGLIAILATPLAQQAFTLIPVVTVATALLSIPVAWKLARYVRAAGAGRDPSAAGA